MTKKFLSKQEILSAQDLKTEVIEVPEWGGAVRVRTMTGSDRDTFENALFGKGDKNRVRAWLVALTVVDENGHMMFSESDVDALGRKSAAALNRVFNAAQRINAISESDAKEMEKN